MKRGIRYLAVSEARFFGSKDARSGKAEVRTAAFNCQVQQQAKEPSKSSFKCWFKRAVDHKKLRFLEVVPETKKVFRTVSSFSSARCLKKH